MKTQFVDYRGGSLALVLALHTVAIFAAVHESDYVLPATSVPIVVSFVSSAEATQPKPALASKRQPITVSKINADPTPMPEPVASDTAAAPEASTPEVIPPRFDAAYLNNPVPAYPAVSRRLGEEGRVMLRVFVQADGSAREVQILTSSGWARLDRAAKESVERWTFAPARRGDQPAAAWVVVPITFKLS